MADSSNIRRWSGSGLVLVDLTGSGTVPTSGDEIPHVDFSDSGYISDAGVTISEATDTQSIFAWQNGDNVRTLQTSHDVTLAFSFLEWNDVTLAVCYPTYSSATRSFTITGAQPPRLPWVVDAFDEDHHLRLCLPDAQVTEKDDVSLLHTDGSPLGVTLTAYPDTYGVKVYSYLSPIGS